MTSQQQKLLSEILSRKSEKHPIVCLHALDQPLTDDLCRLIIELGSVSSRLDNAGAAGYLAGLRAQARELLLRQRHFPDLALELLQKLARDPNEPT